MACPICAEEFTRVDLEADRLSLEDVPPKSVGGRPLCVTCKRCNNTGGSLADSALAQLALMKQMRDAAGGVGSYKGPAAFEIGGTEVRGVLSAEAGRLAFQLRRQINNPADTTAVLQHMQSLALSRQSPIQFRISGTFRAGMRPLFVSMLRAGYLAAFSMYGYRFAIGQALGVVRRQIFDPRNDYMPRSAVTILAGVYKSNSNPAVLVLRTPIECIGVFLPPRVTSLQSGVMVLLPMEHEPDDFFHRLADSYIDVDGKKRANFDGVEVGWPTGPEFRLDLPDA